MSASDIDPQDFTYFQSRTKLTIIGASVSSRMAKKGEKIDTVAFRVQPQGAPAGKKFIKTYQVDLSTPLGQALHEMILEADA